MITLSNAACPRFTVSQKLRQLFASAPALMIAVISVATALSGCAYRAGTVDRSIPGGYRSVAVPVFKNHTKEVGVETYFTNALIRELQRGRIGQITDKGDAQVTLEGSVDSIQYVPTSQVAEGQSSSQGTALPKNTILNTAYRVLLTATLRLRRNSDQKVIWEGGFNGEASYLAPKVGIEGLNSANALYNNSARYNSIEHIADTLMSEAHDRLTENF